jgi:hypothetical protein
MSKYAMGHSNRSEHMLSLQTASNPYGRDGAFFGLLALGFLTLAESASLLRTLPAIGSERHVR